MHQVMATGLDFVSWRLYEKPRGIPLSKRYPMLAHHLLSVVAYGGGLSPPQDRAQPLRPTHAYMGLPLLRQ